VEHTDLRNDPKCGIMKTSGAWKQAQHKHKA